MVSRLRNNIMNIGKQAAVADLITCQRSINYHSLTPFSIHKCNIIQHVQYHLDKAHSQCTMYTVQAMLVLYIEPLAMYYVYSAGNVGAIYRTTRNVLCIQSRQCWSYI